MKVELKHIQLLRNKAALDTLPQGKLLINTINAFSYNNAQKDDAFAEALLGGDVLIPDGMSVVKACQWLKNPDAPRERVAGWDLFVHHMHQLNTLAPLETSIHHAPRRVLFFGSSERVLSLIRERAAKEYPHLDILTYSPPYKETFSQEDSQEMVRVINEARPHLLWIGMTAPKQEKWAFQHWNELNIQCHCGTIGAVFDFYAGTLKRAPLWWQQHGLEWLYRLIREPHRMWRRYIIGNAEFLLRILKEKFYR